MINWQKKKVAIPSTDWNDRGNADKWKAAWEDMANAELKRLGFDSHIDRRTYAEQGIEQVPTIHMGAAASQMEKRGIRTERGDINREAVITNNQMAQLRARIKKVKDWIIAQPLADAPAIGDMLAAINSAQNFKSNWKKLAGLKLAAKVLIFVQKNGIKNPEQLADKVTELHQRQYDLGNDVKSKERRISKLNDHLSQVDINNQHKAVYKKFKELKPKTDKAAQTSLNPFTRNKAAQEHEAAAKKQKAYYDKHTDEISKYESASAYLKANLNGYGKIPEKDWRTEREKLLAERYSMVDEYYRLNDDLKNVEALRRGAENLMRGITPERPALYVRFLLHTQPLHHAFPCDTR